MGNLYHSLDLADLDAAADGKIIKKVAGLWTAQDESAGVSTFLALTDTPGTFAGQANRLLVVDPTELFVDFLDKTLVLDTDTLAIDASRSAISIGPNDPGNRSAATGAHGIAIGDGANASAVGGTDFISIGTNAGAAQIDSSEGNSYFGRGAGERLAGISEANSSGNIGIGKFALRGAVAGAPQANVGDNIALGVRSLTAVITNASRNLGFGRDSFTNLTSGVDNIGLGVAMGLTLTTGSRNFLVRSNVPAAGTNDYMSIVDTIFGDLSADKIRIGGTGLVIGDVSLRLADTDKAFMPNVVANPAAVTAPEEGMVIMSTADESLMGFQNGAWVQLSTSSNRFFESSDMESTTTGTTPLSKVQISETVPAGTYELWGSYTWRRASVSGDAQIEIIEDLGGTPVVHWAQIIENTDASADQRNSSSFNAEFTLGAGAVTFDIMFNNATGFGGVTVGISQARIWLRRVGP